MKRRRRGIKEQEHETKVQRQKAPAAREITLWTSRDSRTTTRPPRAGIHTARQENCHRFLLYTAYPSKRCAQFLPDLLHFEIPALCGACSRPCLNACVNTVLSSCVDRKQRAGCLSHISEFNITLLDRQCVLSYALMSMPVPLALLQPAFCSCEDGSRFLLSTLIFLNQPVFFTASPSPT